MDTDSLEEPSLTSPLFKLPREDILYKNLFTKIHPKDLWICRRVCKEFRRICDEYFQFYCSVLDFRVYELTPGGVNALMSLCRSVRKFYWHNKLVPNIPLDLTNYKTYFWGGKQLKILELHNINLHVLRNSYIGNYCKELCTLKITNCEVSCDHLLRELTASAMKLTELDLSKSILSSTSFSEFICNKKDLVVLKLAYCKISELDIQRATRSCPKLREVDLRYTSASDTTIQYVLEYCGQISVLLLDGCPLANSQIIIRLTERNIFSDVAQAVSVVQVPSVYIQI